VARGQARLALPRSDPARHDRGCPERFDWRFFLYILTFRRGPRQRTEARLADHEAKVRRFTGPRAFERWVDGLRGDGLDPAA